MTVNSNKFFTIDAKELALYIFSAISLSLCTNFCLGAEIEKSNSGTIKTPENSLTSKVQEKLNPLINANKIVIKITDPWLERVIAWDENTITDKKYEKLVCSYETTDRTKIKEISEMINKANIKPSIENSSIDIRSAIFFTLDNGDKATLLVGPPYLNSGKLDGFFDDEKVIINKDFLYNFYSWANRVEKDKKCDDVFMKYSKFLKNEK